MNIGSILDLIIEVGIGIYFIFLSIKRKEKLGNKAVFIRFAGIVFLIIALFSLLFI